MGVPLDVVAVELVLINIFEIFLMRICSLTLILSSCLLFFIQFILLLSQSFCNRSSAPQLRHVTLTSRHFASLLLAAAAAGASPVCQYFLFALRLRFYRNEFNRRSVTWHVNTLTPRLHDTLTAAHLRLGERLGGGGGSTQQLLGYNCRSVIR